MRLALFLAMLIFTMPLLTPLLLTPLDLPCLAPNSVPRLQEALHSLLADSERA